MFEKVMVRAICYKRIVPLKTDCGEYYESLLWTSYEKAEKVAELVAKLNEERPKEYKGRPLPYDNVEYYFYQEQEEFY